MKNVKSIAAFVAVVSMLLLGGCRRCCKRYISQEIEVEIVSTYIQSDGTWATCLKRDDGVRIRFSGRLGKEGDRMPLLYTPGLNGGTYQLTPR